MTLDGHHPDILYCKSSWSVVFLVLIYTTIRRLRVYGDVCYDYLCIQLTVALCVPLTSILPFYCARDCIDFYALSCVYG